MKEQNLISEIYKRLDNLWFVFSNIFHYLQDVEPKTCHKFPILFNILKDSMLGIEEYINNGIGDNIGLKYLKLYGLLQISTIQQETIKQIYNLRNIEYPNAWFGYIRYLRDDFAGHPSNNKLNFYTQINKETITNETIDVSNTGSRNLTEKVYYRKLLIWHLRTLKKWLQIATDEYQQNIIW